MHVIGDGWWRANGERESLALSLPAGRTGTLYLDVQSQVANGTGLRGVLHFFGARLTIDVPDPEEVLFPTDVGLSLLHIVQQQLGARPFLGKSVVDIGCGSGLYSVALLAAGSAHVTAIDVNPMCTDVARSNVITNGLDESRLETVTADISTFVPKRRFDIAVANPPHLPYDASYAHGAGVATALIGGADGRALYDVLLSRLDDLLTPGGTLLIAHSTLADVERTKRELAARGYLCRLIGTCELDIPLVTYAKHRAAILARLKTLRAQGKARYADERCEVQILSFTRPSG